MYRLHKLFTVRIEILVSAGLTFDSMPTRNLMLDFSEVITRSLSIIPSKTIAWTPDDNDRMVVCSSDKGTLPKMFNFSSKMWAPLVPTRFSSIPLKVFFSFSETLMAAVVGLAGGAAVLLTGVGRTAGLLNGVLGLG